MNICKTYISKGKQVTRNIDINQKLCVVIKKQ